MRDSRTVLGEPLGEVPLGYSTGRRGAVRHLPIPILSEKMTISKPSVTKAFNDIVFPKMINDGYIKISSKYFARLRDNEVLQWISVNVKSGVKREYIIEYGSQLICQPNNSNIKTIGGNFTKLSSGGAYGAQNDKMLEKSIVRVLTAYLEEVKPILSNSNTIQKLISQYSKLSEINPASYETGHPNFSIACAYASLGEIEKSLLHSEYAQEQYSQVLLKQPMAEWANEYISKVKELKEALEKNNYNSLLNTWRGSTIKALKIKKLQSLKNE